LNSTHHTADAAGGEAGAVRNRKPGWGDLLVGLTNDELRQYFGMAEDQINAERRLLALYIGMGIAAAGLTLYSGYQIISRGGVERTQVYQLLAAAFLAYWPYRSRKIKKLWRGHCEAVETELARRTTGEEDNDPPAQTGAAPAENSASRASRTNRERPDPQ